MVSEIKRVILVGKAGSGKDYAKTQLLRAGFTGAVSYTTRPPRRGEIDGVAYNFVTEHRFERLEDEGFFYEHQKFNGWYYGTAKEELNIADVFIMTPSGIKDLDSNDRSDSLIVFINPPQSVLEKRLYEREDTSDSVTRRIQADTEDFSEFIDWDVQVRDPEFNILEDVLLNPNFSGDRIISPKILNTINRIKREAHEIK